MEISNFSSLIEVGVTLNIACVAIEYVKTYTNVLYNQVFNLGFHIKDAVKSCLAKLNEVMDETTLSSVPESLAGGRSILTLKRQLTRDRNTLSDEIKNKQKELENEMTKICDVKNVSSICLWLSLYGIVGLFMIGIGPQCENTQNINIHIFWTFLTIIALIFSVVGWISDGEHRPWWKFGYCSLRFALVSFAIGIIISLSALLLCTYEVIVYIIEIIWNYTLIISMIMLYSNFIVSSIEVWKKAKNGKIKIESEKNNLLTKCAKWNNDATDLLGALHVDERLSHEETE